MYRSLYEGFYISGCDVLPPQCSSREVRLYFDPQVAMACRHTLCQFRLIVDICFANSFFAEGFGYFFLFLIVPMNPLLFLHTWVPTGDPPSRDVVKVYILLCEQCHFILHSPFFPSERAIGCRLVPRTSIPSGVRLFAGCAMSYTIRIRQSLAVRVRLLHSKVQFAERNPNFNSFRLFAVRDTKRERERERERENWIWIKEIEVITQLLINKAWTCDQPWLIRRRETKCKWKKSNSWQEVWTIMKIWTDEMKGKLKWIWNELNKYIKKILLHQVKKMNIRFLRVSHTLFRKFLNSFIRPHFTADRKKC